MHNKTILFAVLDWGLGHATRSAVIIDELLALEHKVVIASSGKALAYLQLRYPNEESLALSDYTLTYAKKLSNWKTYMLFQAKPLFKQYQEDKIRLKVFLERQAVDLIISDNRPSIVHSKIPSVYITHQLQLPRGSGSSIANFIHQKRYAKYQHIWVPDVASFPNLSGYLGSLNNTKLPIHYLGLLSNYSPQSEKNEYQYTVILSGPEPQRSMLEVKLISIFPYLKGQKMLVRGTFEPMLNTKDVDKNTKVINVATNSQLQQLLASSACVICRSGYSSIMDLVSAQKKAILIPTPGQPEQEYLAQHMQQNNWFRVISQDVLTATSLKNASQQMLQPPVLEKFTKNVLRNLLDSLFSR